MKNILLFTIILCTQIAFGQNLIETRTALLTDGDYPLEGTVYLELFEDNSIQLRFDTNYLTQSNVFDVHVFLTNNNNYTTPIDTTGMLLVENIGTISGLNYSSGPMTFNLPSGVEISDYQHIVFICIQFGQLHWGDGAFGASDITNNIDRKETIEVPVTVYPNPTESGLVEIQLQKPHQKILIEVLSLNGKLISSEYILSSKQLHQIELQGSGTYFLRLTTNNNSTIKKIIRL